MSIYQQEKKFVYDFNSSPAKEKVSHYDCGIEEDNLTVYDLLCPELGDEYEDSLSELGLTVEDILPSSSICCGGEYYGEFCPKCGE